MAATMPQLIANEADIIRARESYVSGLLGSLDAKRPAAWTVYGYPAEVTFHMLLSAYQRGGPAHGAVHRILDKCWQAVPRIKQPKADEPTPWEDKLGKMLTAIGAWRKLRELDKRNMVGRYAALIYRVRDGLALREPLVRGSELVDLVPLYEDQIKVTAWNSDTSSEDFSKPTMFQYRTRSPQAGAMDTQGQPDQWVDVHPSRVQILAEGSVCDMFEGVPLLLPAFNALVDMEKITGGSAESYLKNSARVLSFEYSSDASIQTAVGAASADEVKAKHEERVKALNRNQDAAVVMQGGKAGVLQTQTHDPSGAWGVAACTFAAAVQIPFTVLFGQQTGRLASDEDKADMVARCTSRQVNELTPMLTEFITRMQAAGLVEAGEFEIEWPPLDAPSDNDKVELLKGYTAAMQQASSAGLTEPMFDANELRGVVGFEPRADDGMPEEGDPGNTDPTTGKPIEPADDKQKPATKQPPP